jgi:hypothetical protein
MDLHLDIQFEQLVKLAKQLSSAQWNKLKEEVEKKNEDLNDLESFLLSSPTFTEAQLNEIENARKEISQWRKK